MTLSTLVVQNGWKGGEQSWNELQEVQVKVLDPLESGEGGWCAPNFVPGAPKDGQKGPNLAKI